MNNNRKSDPYIPFDKRMEERKKYIKEKNNERETTDKSNRTK